MGRFTTHSLLYIINDMRSNTLTSFVTSSSALIGNCNIDILGKPFSQNNLSLNPNHHQSNISSKYLIILSLIHLFQTLST